MDPTNLQFSTKLSSFNESVPFNYIKSITPEGENFLRVRLRLSQPFHNILVHFEDSYKSCYPHGAVTFFVSEQQQQQQKEEEQKSSGVTNNNQNKSNNNQNVVREHAIPSSALPTFEKICSTINAMAHTETAQVNIDDLFPFQEEENGENDHDDDNSTMMFTNKQSEKNKNNNNNKMNRRAFSGTFSATGSSTKNSPSSSFCTWENAGTFENYDVALEAINLNKTLSSHIEQVNQSIFSSPIEIKTISEASLVTITFSVSVKEMCLLQLFEHDEDNTTNTSIPNSSSMNNNNNKEKQQQQEQKINVVPLQPTKQNLKFFTQTLATLDIDRNENFIFVFTLDPTSYPQNGSIKNIKFGQNSNFASGTFPGAIGQCNRILPSFVHQFLELFCRQQQQQQEQGNQKQKVPLLNHKTFALMMEGFEEKDCEEAIQKENGDLYKALANLQKLHLGVTEKTTKLQMEQQQIINNNNNNETQKSSSNAVSKFFSSIISSSSSDSSSDETSSKRKRGSTVTSSKKIPSLENGLFLACVKYIVQRFHTLSQFCCICDQTHVFASTTSSTTPMAGVQVCTRPTCQFKFSKLNVAVDIASRVAIETGVVDLLIALAREAVMSARWKLILKPFPTLYSEEGKKICGSDDQEENEKHIKLVREIFKGFPLMKKLVQSSESANSVQETLKKKHALAPAALNWVLSSNKSVLKKLTPEQRIGFMDTPHQFRMISATPERTQRFEELKAKHGAYWCFHGSGPDNFFSIMRHGLRNVSNTPMMTHGAASGQGIYAATYFSTSASYSQMYNNNYYNNLQANSTTAAVDPKKLEFQQQEFIDSEKNMRCILICEVIPEGLTCGTSQQDGVFVHPKDDHVIVRFLFVYTHDQCPSDPNMILSAEEKLKTLNQTLAMTDG